MTREELRKNLTMILADLYAIKHMLEQAVRTGVPPDTRYVVHLHTTAKHIRSILAKLDELEPTVLEEST